MLRLIFIIFLCFPFLTNAQSWQNLHPGLSYKKLISSYKNHNVSLHVLKVNPQKLTLKPILSQTPQSVKTLAQNQKALAMLNANFFDTNHKTLGLVVQNKKTLHAFKKISWWSVFCIKNQTAQIIHSSDYQSGQCDQAIQAGPRLIVNGKISELKEHVSLKSAVGINNQNEVFLIATENRVPITEFAKILKKPVEKGGLALNQALNLDGGPSTQMYIKTENFSLNLAHFVAVPVGLGVFEK